jgi:hypothetical protein
MGAISVAQWSARQYVPAHGGQAAGAKTASTSITRGSAAILRRTGTVLAVGAAWSASGLRLATGDGARKLTYRTGRKAGCVIRDELTRLFTWEERHRRLAARLFIALGLTFVVLAIGSVLIWIFESGVKGGDIHGFGDAVFFTAVQLLTISSSITNPLTTAGKVVDVALEAWAIFVVTAVAGSFASFFSSGDSS